MPLLRRYRRVELRPSAIRMESDDRHVWTGSCPCQPFSTAGKGAGFSDERHLWPAFNHLISQCKPAIVLGEQVASKDSDTWIDLVHTDMEALGYAFGAIPFPSAGIGAPHIRDRLYWVADTAGKRLEGETGTRCHEKNAILNTSEYCAACGLADTQQHHRGSQATAANHGQQEADRPTDRTGGYCVLAGGVADTNGSEPRRWELRLQPENGGDIWVSEYLERSQSHHTIESPTTGPTNGHWRDADWLLCRDGKWRPVEPGTFPLVDGAASRVVRLRAYGNAINAKAAQAFIECVM